MDVFVETLATSKDDEMVGSKGDSSGRFELGAEVDGSIYKGVIGVDVLTP